jgi:hypothetical protein
MSLADQTYRRWVQNELHTFPVRVKESDLLISAESSLRVSAENLLRKIRKDLESYIARDPKFAATFEPHEVLPDAPAIAQEMAQAGCLCGVGPMAAVAGAVAEYVGKGLLNCRAGIPMPAEMTAGAGALRPTEIEPRQGTAETSQVIVENGGDIFIYTTRPRIAAIYAGNSPHSGKLGVRISRLNQPLGLCTSSATVGPSISFGKADAAVILATSATLADAAASLLGNQIKGPEDITPALESLQPIAGLLGAVAIYQEHLGAWGEIELVPLKT